MKSKTPQHHRSKSVKTSSLETKQYTEERSIEKRVFQSTPPQSPKNYLTDEIWDILPKTDYTYARSGSYSPRFIGRKYKSPNMSRYRIRVNGRGQESEEAEFSDEGEELMHIHDYDDYNDNEFDDDRSSNVSYETVIVDGMSLRSGKSLQTMQETVNEYDVEEEIPVTSVRGSVRRTTIINTRTGQNDINSTSKKYLKSQQNAKQLSMSEQKSQQGRRSLRNQIELNGNSDHSRNYVNEYRRRTISSYTNGYDTSSVSSNSVHANDKYHNHKVRKTLEYDETDTGENEKAALEISEKMMKSKSHNDKSSQQYISHLYGLDSGESDTELSDTGSGYTTSEYDYNRSRRSRGQQGFTVRRTTTTTVVTTITETLNRFTQPVREQTWKYVGQPAWTYVGNPVWTYLINPVWEYLLHPILSIISTIVLSVWESVFGETGMVRSVVDTLFVGEKSGTAGPFTYISSAIVWILRKVESFIMQFVLLDVWLLSRRRNQGCCFCLPIILLLPFLIALASHKELWSLNIFGNSSIFSFPYSGRPTPTIPDNVPFDKQEFFNQLNQEVKVWLLQHQQLQSTNQLSVADVEVIVYRILQKELASLRDEMAQLAVVNDKKQGEWKRDHEERIEHIIKQYNGLLVNIQNLESTISQQKEQIANRASGDYAQQSLHLAGLENKLTAQKARLDELELEFGGFLLKMKNCCHNETVLAALVRDGVDAVLKERMAGYANGMVTDAFSEWLRLNFVNQVDGDSKLKSLESDLRADVMSLIAALEGKQQQYYHELQKLQEEKQANPQYNINTGIGMGIDEQKVKMLIEAALQRYSADRIGIPDYALESAGGTIVSTRCSETFYRKTALLSVFGVPLWYSSNSPRTIIQPEVLPGQCWAFSGAQGYIVIQTSTLITPSGFTLEHISKSLSPSGKLDTAPKDFTVIGLGTESDQNGMSLGNFTYTNDDRPLQYFPIQVGAENLKPFHLYELRILNNHGSVQFTCLYRFRIHGKPFQSV